MEGVWLRGGRLADGSQADVVTSSSSGLVTAVGRDVVPPPGVATVDCSGMVVLPAPAEPHVHLDKVATSGLVANPDGTLAGALAAWAAGPCATAQSEIAERATAAVERLVAHGTTAIRTQVDVRPEAGLAPLRALLAVKADVEARGIARLQLAALVSPPVAGAAGRASRRLLDAALDAGADVVGGLPHLDPDPVACTEVLVRTAADHGVRLDVHTDETLDPDVLTVRDLARLVGAADLRPPGVAASHCVSLGVQPADVQAAVAAELAAAGVAVIALPLTNLSLQARGVTTAPPRGTTALRALLDAGVIVAAGADNTQDPFCAMGRLDAFEVASLLVVAGHLSPEEAWHACTVGARHVLGLPPNPVAAGAPADLLCVEGRSLAEAIASGSENRTTLLAGTVVARTRVSRQLLPR